MNCPICEERRNAGQNREQQERYHAMLGDIARQCRHLNQMLGPDDWKRLCVDQFRIDCLKVGDERLADYWKRNGFRLMPGLDGTSLVALGKQTREFPKYVATAFIEWLFAWGADHEVEWSDPTQPPMSVYEAMAA